MAIGVERIIRQLEDDEIFEKLKVDHGFNTTKFFKLGMSGNINDFIDSGNKFRKKIKNFQKLLANNWRFILTECPRWTESRVQKRIQTYLDRGENPPFSGHFWKSKGPSSISFKIKEVFGKQN